MTIHESQSQFEFQIQHSKLNKFGHYSKLTQCRLHISYQAYEKSCHLVPILVNKVFQTIVNKSCLDKSCSQNFIFLDEKKSERFG